MRLPVGLGLLGGCSSPDVPWLEGTCWVGWPGGSHATVELVGGTSISMPAATLGPGGVFPRLFTPLSGFGDAAFWAGQAGGGPALVPGEDAAGVAGGCNTEVYFGSG